MIIKLENGESLVAWAERILAEEFKKLTTTEFKEIFDRSPVKVKIFRHDEMNKLWNNHIRDIKRGNLSHSEILEQIQRIRFSTKACPVESQYTVCVSRDHIVVKNLCIYVNERAFMSYILDKIATGFEGIEDDLRLCMRHEVGHIMDYITFQGMRRDEFEEIFYRKWGDPNAEYDERARLNDYYSMDAERTANMLAGIDAQKMIDNDLYGIDQLDKTLVLDIKATIED